MVLVGIELSTSMLYVDGGLDASELAWQRSQVMASAKGGPSHLGSTCFEESEDSDKEELLYKLTSTLAREFSFTRSVHYSLYIHNIGSEIQRSEWLSSGGAVDVCQSRIARAAAGQAVKRMVVDLSEGGAEGRRRIERIASLRVLVGRLSASFAKDPQPRAQWHVWRWASGLPCRVGPI